MSEKQEPKVEIVEANPILKAITSAEIDTQIATAKKYRRNTAKFLEDAKAMACINEAVAESCMYSKPQGNKMIQGKSIRLAEICAGAFTNLRWGARVIDVNRDTKEVTVQGVCHDLETNVAVSVEVTRSIRRKDGSLYAEHMIVTTCNAGNAIALRNAMFKVIPVALADEVYEAARKVAVGDAATLSDRRDKAMKSFANMGIHPDRVLNVLKVNKVEQITLKHLEILIGLHNGIKNGEVTPDETFPKVEPENDDREQSLKRKLHDKGIDVPGGELADKTFEDEAKPKKKEPDTPKKYHKPKQDKLDV